MSHYQLKAECFISDLWLLCVTAARSLATELEGHCARRTALKYEHVICGSRVPGKNTGRDVPGVIRRLPTRLWKSFLSLHICQCLCQGHASLSPRPPGNWRNAEPALTLG